MKERAEQRHRSDTPPPIAISWGAVASGVLVSYALAFILGVVLVNVGLGGNLQVLPLVQFLALFVGGYVAGRWANVSGFMNGVAVAIVYIVIWAAQNSFTEAWLVQNAGPLALPPMNMGGIVLGDFLNLSAAAFGGWLAERRNR